MDIALLITILIIIYQCYKISCLKHDNEIKDLSIREQYKMLKKLGYKNLDKASYLRKE